MAQPAPEQTAEPRLIVPERGVSPVVDGIVALSCPVPFDVGTVNVYLLLGSPLTLVDTGSRLRFTIDDLEALVLRAGVRLADIEQVLLTHRHIDHFGLARDVVERSGASVVSSAIDGPFMAAWEGMITGSREQLKSSGRALGIPEQLFDLAEKGWRAIAAAAVAVNSDRLVKDGEVVRAGGRDLRVIESPGHTEGLITLLEEQTGIYFANDHVLRHITPNPDVYDYNPASLRSGLPDYVASLRALRDLPASLVLPGHGVEMTDLGGRIDEVLVHHQQRAVKVLGAVAEGHDTVFDLVGQVWQGLRPGDVHLAVREIIGHLVLLESEGGAAHDLVDGVLRYRAL
jgi:glyoxylase-like metal-dependent hydrolase (beta-lactamase superfamily II)